MKKIILITLLCLVVLAIPTVIILQQRANDRRVAAITDHHAALERLLLKNGVSPEDISRQAGCARTQEKYGAGDKYCGRDLNAKFTNIGMESAQNVASTLRDALYRNPDVAMDHDHNPTLSTLAPGASRNRGYLYYRLRDATYCNTELVYSMQRDDLAWARGESPDIGDLQIRVGCQDNSWWLRTFGG